MDVNIGGRLKKVRLEKGYTLKDRLLRPALVIVSKGASVKEEAAEGARNSDEQY